MSAWKITGAVLGVLVVAIVAVGLAMYFRLLPIPGPVLSLLLGTKGAEHSARFYPHDTLAYAWLTLAPGGDQLEDLRQTWDRLNEMPEFRSMLSDWREEFEEETGVDFQSAVVDWLGPEMSVGLMEYDRTRDEATFGAVVQVRDRDLAEATLDDWLDYMARSEGADFSPDSYRDFDVWESDDQAYGLSDDWLVVASTSRALEDLIDGIDGETDRTLADAEQFQTARATLPNRRFASVYVDLEAADELSETLDFEGVGLSASGFGAQRSPEWVAGSAGWSDQTITLEFTAPMGIDHPLQLANLADPAERFHASTMFYTGWTFDPDLDDWRDAMRHYRIGETFDNDSMIELINEGMAQFERSRRPPLGPEDTMDELLDRVLSIVEMLSGIDLERDFMDHLAGELAIAVTDTDFDAIEADPAGNPVELVLMLPHREDSGEDLESTMRNVVRQVEEVGAGFIGANRVSLGSDADGMVLSLGGGLFDTAYTPGYVVHDGYLTIASTEGMLRSTVALQQDDSDSLQSDAEYRRVLEMLPDERHWLLYVDVQGLLRQIDTEDFGADSDELQVARAVIGRLAASAYLPHCESGAGRDCGLPEGEVGRARMALTLFPE